MDKHKREENRDKDKVFIPYNHIFLISLAIFFMLLFAGVSFVSALTITGDHTADDSDYMFLVNQGETWTFVSGGTGPFTWQVNKVNQTETGTSFTWTVPNKKGIWEIRVINGMEHKEWVVSTLSIEEAPDFFDFFTDKKYTNRTDTDPWNRPLPNWTISWGDVDTSKGFLTVPEDVGLVSQDPQTIEYGTWKIRFLFTEGFEPSRASGFRWELIRTSYINVKYGLEEDSHHYFHGDGYYQNACYDKDCGFGTIPKRWYEATIIRTPDNFWHTYIDGIIDFKWYDDGTDLFERDLVYGQLIRVYNNHAYTPNDVYVDNFEIYNNTYLFPESVIENKTYKNDWFYSGGYSDGSWKPIERSGIVIKGRNVTISEINSAINDPSLFEYDPATKTATVHTDLVVGDGAELIIEDETLKFDSTYDGELQFAVLWGATLNIDNSTVTSINDYYWSWRFTSSTHLGGYTAVWSSNATVDGAGNTAWSEDSLGYAGDQSVSIKNSTINNTAYIFFDSPLELVIENTRITNLNEVDTGGYSGNPFQSESGERREFFRGNKSFFIATKNLEILDFNLKNVTITEKAEPLDITFIINRERDNLSVFDLNVGNNNIVVNRSVRMDSFWMSGYENFRWPSYMDISGIGLVNTKFGQIIVNAPDTEALVKYYLDVKVVDSAGAPVSGATVTVTNEEDDANYPAENIDITRGYGETSNGKYYWAYWFPLSHHSPWRSTDTGADGHTPLPSDQTNTIIITDYLQEQNSTTDFNYTITVTKDGKTASIHNLDIGESWYREDSNTPIKIVVCDLGTEMCSITGISTYSISGYVKYENGTGIHNAYVTNDMTSAEYTNSDGYYIHTGLTSNIYSINASKTGFYSNLTFKTIEGADVENVNITLIEETSLVGEWHFDEGDGNIAYDFSGSGNDGTIHGAAWTTGKIGSAIEFDGVNDYINCGNDASLNAQNYKFSVMAWVLLNDLTSRQRIIDRGTAWYFELGDQDNKICFSIYKYGYYEALSSNLSIGEWYHVAATYDGTTMRLYIDGIEDGTNTVINAGGGADNEYLGIGAWLQSDGSNGLRFNGTIDELKIYNRALTAEEVRADYEAGFVELNTLSGTVTSFDSTGIADATVTLATIEGTEINTIQTDSTGRYEFTDVSPGNYNITATKRSYWPDSDPVTVTTEAPITADIVLCQKGDLNTNSEPADAGDLAMMADATAAGTSDVTYDLDGDGNPADAADLTLLKEVSVGVAELE